MNGGQPLIANFQTAESVQPGQSALHHPACLAQAAPVRGIASRQQGANAARGQSLAMRAGVIGPIALHAPWPTARASLLAADWRNAIDQRQQLRHIVVVCSSHNGLQRNTTRFGDDVVLRTRLTAIGWVRSSFFPPCAARTDELSTMAREKSSLSASRNLLSSTSCTRCHTPRACHALSRRQQVMPEPQPISLGSMLHGTPLRNTYKMPVRARRFATGLRPAWRLRRRFGGGSSGSINAHSSSSRIGLATSVPLPEQSTQGAPYRRGAKCTSRLPHFVTRS